uniref:Uncharacterized protein n=1 Tax=Phlebotomus papatasi TaxID=29031 RepID=A0A1B0DLF7_PHLPP
MNLSGRLRSSKGPRCLITCELKYTRSTKSSDEEAQKIRKTVYTFLWKLREKKAKCNRKENAFLTKNTEWLETSLSFELPKLKVGVRGRPDKAFDTCSERAKRFKTQDIRETCSKEMLAYATQMSYRAGGRSDIARKITDLTSQPLQPPSPKPESKSTNKTGMSDDEGLAMMIDADLSRNQYEIIREKSKVFPSYKCIQNAKKRCYPEPEYFRITEYSAEIQLQALLNLTSKRLCMAQENDFNILDDTVKEDQVDVKLICKWGFDGCTQSEYKQKFVDSQNSDGHLFITCLVPIRMVLKK